MTRIGPHRGNAEGVAERGAESADDARADAPAETAPTNVAALAVELAKLDPQALAKLLAAVRNR